MRAAWPSARRAKRSTFEIASCIKKPSTLQDRGDAHAAGGADGDQPAARATLGELLGERGEDAGSGRGKGMADGNARAGGIELRALDAAERLRTLQPFEAVVVRFPGLQRAQHLRSEGLV